MFLSLTQKFFGISQCFFAECSFKFLVASPSSARIWHYLGDGCRWRRDFRDGSFSRGMTIFALHGWSTTGEEKVSRSVDKISVDRSRRARKETEVDNRTAVLGLHKLKHCEVARKNVETEIVRMTDPSACADMFGAGSFCAVRKGAFWEMLPVPPRGRFGKFSNQFFVFPCESASLRVRAALTCAEGCRNILPFT